MLHPWMWEGRFSRRVQSQPSPCIRANSTDKAKLSAPSRTVPPLRLELYVSALLDAALEYCNRGWSVFPLNGKRAMFPWEQWQTQRPTAEQVTQWWTDSPDAWIGCALGQVSGIVRLDVDGEASNYELMRLGGVPTTASFTTPSGGKGYLLKFLDGLSTQKLWKGTGPHEELRVQSNGAYTVLPPSPGYLWTNTAAPAKVPGWLHDVAVEQVLGSLVKELRPTLRQPDHDEIIECLKHIPADEYDAWVQVGMALKSVGEEYLPVWDEWSKQSEKYKEGSCEQKWNSFRCSLGGVTARSLFYWAEKLTGWKPPSRHEPLTDLGNARMLARMGDGKVLHCEPWGWIRWTGRKWTPSEGEKAVQELQKQVIEYRMNRAVESLARHLESDQAADGYEEERKRKVKTLAAIRKHEAESRIRGARKLASSEPALCSHTSKFNKLPWVFNCANGSLDLRTGELRPHDPADMLMQCSAVTYDVEAQCPTFEKAIADILPDSEVRAFVQEFMGVCLTADVSCQMMPIFHGSGANGKSTFINAISQVLSDDYSMKAKRDLLMVSRGASHPTSLARMFGKRLVVCIETDEMGRIDEPLVKELTGGDAIAARFVFQDEWEFWPTHKLVLVTNHKPEIRGTDDGIWRRIMLVPFEQQFKVGDPKHDPALGDKLSAETSGLLNWMLAGLRRWTARGNRFAEVQRVREASLTYREEQDRIGLFIAARCVVGEGRKGSSAKITEAYILWCATNKFHPMNGSAFGRALSDRGFLPESRGSKIRVGIDLA